MKNDNHLFEELPFGGFCPDCESPVEFYATNPDKQSGKYRCTNLKSCDRDTIWKSCKVETAANVMERLLRKETK